MDDVVEILVFSDNADTRAAVIGGVGLRPAKGLPKVRWIETATAKGTEAAFNKSRPAVLVLDGESAKVGGMAVARQLRDRYEDVPPIVLLVARPQDNWLGQWSGAAVIVSAPLDPRDLQEAVSKALRMAA